MPHFIIECAKDAIAEKQVIPLLESVYKAAEKTGLFESDHIKVRFLPITDYLVGGEQKSFMHAQLRIKDGRTTQQKKALSESVLAAMREYGASVKVMTVEVVDMDSESYAKASL